MGESDNFLTEEFQLNGEGVGEIESHHQSTTGIMAARSADEN